MTENNRGVIVELHELFLFLNRAAVNGYEHKKSEKQYLKVN